MITIALTILISAILFYRFYLLGYKNGHNDGEMETIVTFYSQQIDELKAKIKKL